MAFFGGNFTGLPLHLQEKYLKAVQPYIENGRIQGIRLSTRPDYISAMKIQFLKQYQVTSIELGAQSLNDKVLETSGRGHTKTDVKNACSLLLEAGFETGLQMMTGLPGDSPETSIATAREIVSMGAHTTRIYPTLVVKDTPLEKMFQQGQYVPQSLQEAVELSAILYEIFTGAGLKVLRMGLHPSEGFLNHTSLVAGPFHPAFGEMVLSKVWGTRITEKLKGRQGNELEVRINPTDLNAAIGHKAVNKNLLKGNFAKVRFVSDMSVHKGDLHVNIH